MAILNNFKAEIREKLHEAEMTLGDLAEQCGSTSPSLSRLFAGKGMEKNRGLTKIVNAQFVRAYESLGYDIRVEYVKQEQEDEQETEETAEQEEV